MTAENIERRLAAILSADAVGYSRLMAEDETGTIRSLDDHRERIGGRVRQHRGRVVDAPGDNLLAEFPTALDATLAALEIQQEIRGRNEEVLPERRMEFRIGIHMGDVAVEGDRLFGDGVNIAARLERLAEPGGICISDMVYSQVHRKAQARYEDLGERVVKNVPDPVRVFRVRPGRAVETAAAAEPARRLRPVLTAGVCVLLALSAWVLWQRTASGPPVTTAGAAFANRPAIAVLPFDNLSGDPAQEFFADGITEDLITRLAGWRYFPVIARNSTFTYKGRAVDVKQVSGELGARYVVEGSVQKAGDRVRINAQLIDGTTGHHVWAETYDRELRDIFAVQDEITQAIAAATQGGVFAFESERAARDEPGNLDAWQTVLRGMWHWQSLTADGNAAARRLFEAALEEDPGLSLAASGLALTHYNDTVYQWSEDPERSAEEALVAARLAAKLDPDDPRAHTALAVVYSLSGGGEKMIAAAERAIELNPSGAAGYLMLGTAIGLRDRPDEGIVLIEQAMRLSPRDPFYWAYLDAVATIHFAQRRYGDAIDWGRRTVEREPEYSFGHLLLATSRAHLGELEEARAALGEALALQPDVSEPVLRRGYSAADDEVLDRYLEGLRMAGWEG